VLRLPSDVPISSSRLQPLPDERKPKKPITFELVYESRNRPNFNGSPISVQDWLDDGQHYLQAKAGRLYKVDALTGRSEPFHDPAKMAKGLASLPALGKATAGRLARSTSFRMNPQRTGGLFEHEDDLYYGSFDGTKAARLTKTPGKKEQASF